VPIFDFKITLGDVLILVGFAITYFRVAGRKVRRLETVVTMLWQAVFPKRDCPIVEDK
jgi:hypothetical protein